MPLPVEQFTERVTSSGLLSEEQLRDWLAKLPADAAARTDGDALARELVKQKKLTKFQAEQIYAGKGKSLTLGNYVLLDKLGEGGMGMVLKAYHRRMERIVALKVIAAKVVKDPTTLQRFQREVVAAAKLTHPNIVAAHDADEAKGTHFLVMEYVEGSDLSSWVKTNGPMPVEQAVSCIIQAARGLAFAHDKGVVHRDIKPHNLLMDQSGTVKILDMGLARIEAGFGGSAENADLTKSGAMMGTVDYMSPEQAMDSKYADARSDIYSLGCTLFYLVTGHVAFEADTVMKRLTAHQSAPPPSLAEQLRVQSSESKSGLSSVALDSGLATLDAVFRRMVAKKPDDRPQSMLQVIAELERCVTTGSATVSVASGSNPVARPSAPTNAPANVSNRDADTIIGSSSDSKTNAALSDATVVLDSSVVKNPTSGPTTSLIKSRKMILISAATVVVLLVIAFAMSGKSKQPSGDKLVANPDAQLSESPTNSKRVDPSDPNAAPIAPAFANAPFDAAQARAHQEAWAKHLGTTVETTNSVGAKMILIPPGEFLMGSTDEEVSVALKAAEAENASQVFKDFIEKGERPQHRVVITKPYLMGTTEVTIGQFRKFVDASKYVTEAEQYGLVNSSSKTLDERVNEADRGKSWRSPGYPTTDDLPVAFVSWNDAVAYCQWLSQLEKTTYRLPTEAEWEYACRAGTTTQYSFGDDEAMLDSYGWYNKNAGGQPHPVGTMRPNGFGLHDLYGNLSEWCQDWFAMTWYEKSPSNDPLGPTTGGHRVLRGGSIFYNAPDCRSASRGGNSPLHCNLGYGFRVVRVFDEPAPPPAKAPFDAKQARAHQEAWAKHLGTTVETTNSVGAKMILIPPGEFLMGVGDEQIEAAAKMRDEKNADQAGKDDLLKIERPQHRVILSKPFLMGATEVTIGQFRQFVDATKYVTEAEQYGFGNSRESVVDDKVTDAQKKMNWHAPGFAVTDDSPVTQISWKEAVAYCQWLSKQESTTYRLPTEAEWECACRAGSTTQFSFGDNESELEKHDWYKNNAAGQSHPVGTKRPNAFGLFDMLGNVQEWCGDFFDEQWYEQSPTVDPTGPTNRAPRVVRGGNLQYPAFFSRSSHRTGSSAANRFSSIGFRVVRVLDASAKLGSSPPITADPDRRAAEWVIAHGGDVIVSGRGQRISNLKDLPDGQLEVVQVLLFKPLAGEDADLVPLRELKHVVFVGLDSVQPTTAGIAGLERLPKLQSLSLAGASLNDDRLAALIRLKNVKGLFLVKAKLTASECATLAKSMPQLKSLNLIGNSRLDDSAVEPLGELRNLLNLELQGTQVTAAGVAKLKKALPNCEIQWDGAATSDNTPTASPGRVVDLLALVDVKRDALAGEWTREANSLKVKQGGSTSNVPRLQLPYQPPEEYDFEIEFTQGNGNGTVEQLLSAQSRSFAWVLNFVLKDGVKAGFETLDGTNLVNRKDASIMRPKQLDPGRRYRSRVEVRKGKLRAFLDDELLVEWGGDVQRLDIVPRNALRNSQHLGLAANDRGVLFHKVTVREVSGAGKLTTGVAGSEANSAWTDWLGPRLKHADFYSQFDGRVGWLREGDAITTSQVISGQEVLPNKTRNGAIRLTYLFRDSNGIQINARDHVTNGKRDLYVAEDHGTQISITLIRAGTLKVLVKEPIPASIPKDAPRTLEFRIVGDTLTATFNDSVVATVKDATLTEGNFALVALKNVLVQKVEYQKLDDAVSGLPAGIPKVDVLSKIDVKRDAPDGTWKLEKGMLSTAAPAANGNRRLSLPIDNPPDEYDIRLRVQRTSEGNALVLGLVSGGRRTLVVLDGFRSRNGLWGLENIDGKGPRENGTGVSDQPLKINEPADVHVQVRKTGIRVDRDGKNLFDWKGSPDKLSLHEMWDDKGPPRFFLGAQAGFVIHRLEFLSVSPPDTGAASGGPKP